MLNYWGHIFAWPGYGRVPGVGWSRRAAQFAAGTGQSIFHSLGVAAQNLGGLGCGMPVNGAEQSTALKAGKPGFHPADHVIHCLPGNGEFLQIGRASCRERV